MAGDAMLLSDWVNVDADGQLKLPPRMLAALQIAPTDLVNLRVMNGVLEIRSRREAIEEAQRILEPLPPGVSAVDQLISDRRAEERREGDVRGDAAE